MKTEHCAHGFHITDNCPVCDQILPTSFDQIRELLPRAHYLSHQGMKTTLKQQNELSYILDKIMELAGLESGTEIPNPTGEEK